MGSDTRRRRMMVAFQRTIATPVSLKGTGVHTGEESTLTFRPAPPNTGFEFVRTDLPAHPRLPARVDLVCETERGTTLGRGGVKVHTVEHVLAALAGLGLDNALIGLDGSEPPFGDGSSLPFVKILRSAGFQEQQAERGAVAVTEPISMTQGGVHLVALPSSRLRISFTLDFDHPVVQSQYASYEITEDSFVREIAPARTFCFTRDVEALRQRGLIRGGSLENAVVIGDRGIVNREPLRFEDEFARHKISDLLGDLTLLGCPLLAHIISIKSGHATNVAFIRRLSEALIPRQEIGTMEKRIGDLLKTMPHRYPFLLVDRVLEMEHQKRIVGIKNVTFNEPFFVGHFPHEPVMPGVLIVEALGQLGGYLFLAPFPRPEEKVLILSGLERARFYKPVVPGDQLRLELTTLRLRESATRMVIQMEGKATVDGSLVAEVTLSAFIVDRKRWVV